MSRAIRTVGLACVAVALWGCKGASSTEGLTCGPGPATVSCHYKGGCVDYTCDDLRDGGVCKTPDGQKYQDRKGCEESRAGRWVEKCPCPVAQAIGARRHAEEGRVETTWMYAGGMSREEFQKICETSTQNEFLPPPSAP